ncbi:MAG: hypothetical protein MZV64_63265 [Ignavibacteriales bacterium]|nr:hypothetical protein [Ignavibacteriales bacterium]
MPDDPGVGHGLDGDADGLEERDAGLEQEAEGPAEEADARLEPDRPAEGDAELEPVHLIAEVRPAAAAGRRRRRAAATSASEDEPVARTGPWPGP